MLRKNVRRPAPKVEPRVKAPSIITAKYLLASARKPRSAEKNRPAKPPDAPPSVGSSSNVEDDGISSGDADSQLKELEVVSSITAECIEHQEVTSKNKDEDTTDITKLVNTSGECLSKELNDPRLQAAATGTDSAETGKGVFTRGGIWWNLMLFVCMLFTCMVSLVFAIFFKVRLEGLDLGPPPT